MAPWVDIDMSNLDLGQLLLSEFDPHKFVYYTLVFWVTKVLAV